MMEDLQNKVFNIQYLFPSPIYIANNICIDIIDSLKFETKYIKEKYGVVRTPSLNVDSAHQTISNLKWTDYKAYTILKNTIKIHINNYVSSLGEFNEELNITNMWFNISDKGDFNFPHSHPGSIISGVFYIESLGDSVLRFYNNQYLVSNFMTSNIPNEMSYTSYDIPCVKGNLLLWPSHLIHGNPSQTIEGEKIAVSFNTQFNIVTERL